MKTTMRSRVRAYWAERRALGFRLRSEIFTTEKFVFVASENTLAEDIDSLVKAKFVLMGEVPP